MSRQVKVVRVEENVEEEVVVEVDGQLLTCFASVCPHAIAAGHSYQATLSLWAVDGVVLREADDDSPGIFRIGDGFRHKIVGTLHGSVLHAGVTFEDETFAREYRWLEGRRVSAEADRIEIAFE